jgi:hypothetical protein
MACAKLNEFVAVAEEQRISAYKKRPNVASALKATKIMGWQTMSLDARNVAFKMSHM